MANLIDVIDEDDQIYIDNNSYILEPDNKESRVAQITKELNQLSYEDKKMVADGMGPSEDFPTA